MNVVFGKFLDNNSLLTKLDARFKLLATLILMILSFINLNFYVYLGYFVVIILITLIGKLSLKPMLSFLKNMWFIILLLFVLNVLTGHGVSLNVLGINLYLSGVIDTIYIIVRILMILMISNLLTATTNPSDLTYGLEFYLKPLKIFKIEIEEVAIMMSIAIRFVPTLMEEADKIMKAQVSRGADFNGGGVIKKISAIGSLIIPLFMSCFEKSEDLNEAMIVKGYGMGERSRYKRERHLLLDIFGIILFVSLLALIVVINGVML